MSKSQGEIKKIYKNSGDYVNQGDLLFELNDNQVTAQIMTCEAKMNLVKEYYDNFKIVVDSLYNVKLNDELINPFEEGRFYIEYDEIIKNIQDADTSNERDEALNGYISQYENSLFQYKYEYVGLEAQVNAYKKLLDDYKVFATESGYINYFSNIKCGIMVGTDAIGTISERLTESNAMIDLYVDATNMPFLKENMNVEMTVSGLPQSTYGLLRGKIIKISNDSVVNDNNIFYIISVKPDDITLTNKNKSIVLKNGMVVEARIKYESITWMKWILKKIGILDR
ncbi:MAG: HlyD family efflux transporter periplasmic adaptor subunit [Acholeplasmatales bacterium]|nr:HlyD family efflux transporter periplasmic adaptor subunit [Acholeplasmatales bacterium]